MKLLLLFLLGAIGFSVPKSTHEEVSPASSGIKSSAVKKAEAKSFLMEAKRIAAEMRKDFRRPTRENLSGRWSDASGLTLFGFQLEQHGEKISGRGYDSGCSGPYYAFRVAGTYSNGTLDITIIRRNSELRILRYSLLVTQEAGHPRLVDPTDPDVSFQTNFEMQEALSNRKPNHENYAHR